MTTPAPERKRLSPSDDDVLFDKLSAFYDALSPAERDPAMARLLLILAHRIGDLAVVEQAIEDALATGPGRRDPGPPPAVRSSPA